MEIGENRETTSEQKKYIYIKETYFILFGTKCDLNMKIWQKTSENKKTKYKMQ